LKKPKAPIISDMYNSDSEKLGLVDIGILLQTMGLSDLTKPCIKIFKINSDFYFTSDQ